MSGELAIGFVIGALVGLFTATLFYAVRWNIEHDRAEDSERQLEQLQVEFDQALIKFTPHAWLDSDDVAVNIAGKERMYEKHEALVRPGSEVIRIDSELEEDGEDMS